MAWAPSLILLVWVVIGQLMVGEPLRELNRFLWRVHGNLLNLYMNLSAFFVETLGLCSEAEPFSMCACLDLTFTLMPLWCIVMGRYASDGVLQWLPLSRMMQDQLGSIHLATSLVRTPGILVGPSSAG